MTYNTTSVVRRERRKIVDDIIKKEKVDIALLQETHLKERHGLFFSQMTIYRSHEGVGTAIGIKDKIQSARVYIKGVNKINYTAITTRRKSKRVLILSLYIPHNVIPEIIKEELKLLRDESQEYDETIIGGDLNARHTDWNEANDKVKCIRGKALKAWLEEDVDLQLMSPSENTFRGQSKLDHFIVSTEIADQVVDIRTRQEATCHNPVIINMQLGRSAMQNKIREKQFKYKEVDWEKFRTSATHNIVKIPINPDRNYSKEELDEIIMNVTRQVNITMDETLQKVTVKKAKTSDLPQDVSDLLKERRKLVKEKWRAKHNPGWKEIIKDMLRELEHKIDARIKEVEEKDLETKLMTINANHEAFKNIRRITGGNQNTCEKVEFEINGSKLSTAREKAECIATYYEEVYKEVIPPNDKLEEVMEEYEDILCNTNTISFENGINALCKGDGEREALTNLNEVMAIKARLNNKKSAGEDGLTNFILRKLPVIFWTFSTIIFNNCIRLNYFPKSWKRAIIIPLPKVNKAESPKDFRPISMLSNWGKLYEDVIINRMKNEDGLVEGIPEHQFGFKVGHSAVNAVEMMNAEINEARRKACMTGVLSLDITKAFDSVWKEGLIYKTSQMDLDRNVVGVVASFLNDRKAQVKVGNERSREFSVERGVPQGSKLGPLLYNIYTKDIGIKNTERSGMEQFADDTMIWAVGGNCVTVKSNLEKNANELIDQMKNWGIQVNKGKTNFVVVKNGRKNENRTVKDIKESGVMMDGQKIECKEKLKYLGLHINENNTCDDTIDHSIKKSRAAFGKVCWLMKKKGMKSRVKTLVYKQLIRPTMLYGVGAWGNTSVKDLERLNKRERQILRAITGLYRRENGKYYSNKYLYKAAGIKEQLSEVVEKLHLKYETKKRYHLNRWYANRTEELEGRRLSKNMRNMDYQQHTKTWREEGKKKPN